MLRKRKVIAQAALYQAGWRQTSGVRRKRRQKKHIKTACIENNAHVSVAKLRNGQIQEMGHDSIIDLMAAISAGVMPMEIM